MGGVMVNGKADNALTIGLEDGATSAHNMGCGVIVVDQNDTNVRHRIVLTKDDLERMLAWVG